MQLRAEAQQISPPVTDASAERLITQLVANPQRFWGSNERQLRKLNLRREKIQAFHKWSTTELCEHVMSAAAWRLQCGQPTYYLPSFGASGSHLVQFVLASCFPSHDLGEVYVAPGLIKAVDVLKPEQGRLFMEAYHLLHTPNPTGLCKEAAIINTAHSPELNPFERWTQTFTAMLITRRPEDIVLSRTFRKSEYREYLGLSSQSDTEYLEKNIEQCRQFFLKANGIRFAATLRFEDVINDHEAAANSLKPITDAHGVTREQLLRKLRDAIDRDTGTNKFCGSEGPIDPSYRAHAKEALRDICQLLGYDQS
jgi:hypothetical protein